MSLINDALRRAKQAHQESAPPPTSPDPRFRAVDPVTQTGLAAGLLLPALLTAVALLGLFLFWQLSHRGASPAAAPLAVAARTPNSSEVSRASVAAASPAPEVSNTPGRPSFGPAVKTQPESVTTAAPPASTNSVAVASQTDRIQPAAPEPPVQTLPPLKLRNHLQSPASVGDD